jgi:hypothetical protein
MNIYLSVGASTIAGLMVVSRTERHASRPAAPVATDNQRVAAAVAGHSATETLHLGTDLSRIGRRCERAVVTAFRDLVAHGAGDLPALQACTTIYRIHHPEASVCEARRLVAGWIAHHIAQAGPDPVPKCD